MSEKQSLSFFNISEELQEYQQKNYISDIFATFKSKLQVIHATTYIHCFFPAVTNVFFLEQKLIFPCKIGKHMNNIRYFNLFIEQDISDKKYIAFSEFAVLAVN